MSETDRPLLPASTDTNQVDYIVATLKGVLGTIPLAGPLVAEALGTFIPHQRLDRIARFVHILDAKLTDLDQTTLSARLATPAYLDLFEDSLHQAVRALTDQRLEHIATILKNGLCDEEINVEQYKHILQILSQLTDTEIIILESHRYNLNMENEEFFGRHQDLLAIAGSARMESDQETVDRATIHKNYRQHLVRLNLLQPRFNKPKKGEFPEIDEKTGMLKANGNQLTPLGRLLLRQLEIAKD